MGSAINYTESGSGKEMGGDIDSGATADRIAMRRLLPPLVLGATLNPLNSTMLSTALMQITHAFGRDVSAGGLLITPLYITAMIGQPLMGRLADVYSPKRLSYAGLILVLGAVIMGVFAPSFGWLIVSRILLGLGTSANYPSAIAILRGYYAEKGMTMPANVLGWIAVGGMVSVVLGPVIGGWATEWMGWQGIFLVNIPLILAVAWMSRKLPEGRLVKAAGQKDMPRPGMLKLFRERPIVMLIYVQSTAAGLIMYLALYGLPQWLEGVQHFSPSATGYLLLPMSLTAAAASLLVSKRAKPRVTQWLAVTSAATGSLALFLLHAQSPITVVIGVTILVGLITGINPIANQASLNLAVPPELSGVSFGLYRTFVYIGAVGSGILIKFIFHKGVTDASYRQICWSALFSSLIMIVLYFPMFVRRRRRKTTGALPVQTGE